MKDDFNFITYKHKYDEKKVKFENWQEKKCIDQPNYNINADRIFNINIFNEVNNIKIDKNFFIKKFNFYHEKNKLNLRDLYDILVVSYHLFSKIENINFVNTQKQILVYGDITGFDFQKFGNFEFTKINDIEQITDFELNIDKIFIFNGTFFKTNQNSIENYTFLFLLKILYPQNIFINCGINEINFCDQKNNLKYDLGLKYGVNDNEDNSRYSNENDINNLLKIFESNLYLQPLATIVNRQVFIVNGGLPDEPITIDDILDLNKKTSTIYDKL